MRTCGVAVWRNGHGETCGARAGHVVIVRGDYLFSVCERHDKRLKRAFPEMEVGTVHK